MALQHLETLALRHALKDDPDRARAKVVRAYRQTGSIERCAAKLGIPGRTLCRILAEDPALNAQIAAIRTNDS